MSQEITFGMKFQDPKNVTWDDDKLDRAKNAKQLTRIVKNMSKPFVMTLSAPWGSGKTFFLNAWRNEIAWNGEEDVDKIPCVYFSAWEYDCVDDPLLAIVGKIQEELAPLLGYEIEIVQKEITQFNEITKDNKGNNNPFSKLTAITKSLFTKENLCKMFWTVTGRTLNKITVNVFEEALKNTVAEGILKEEDIEKLFVKMEQAVENSPKAKLEAVLKEKREFIETVKEVVSACREKLGKNYPILIMIDELNRCRPDYVINLLERIKNLFEEEGIFFVLAIDKEQLYSVVEHTFGVKKIKERDNRANYLQKFVNMDYELNEPDYNSLVNYFIEKIKKENKPQNNFSSFKYAVENLIKCFKPSSIRDLEKKIEKSLLYLSLYDLTSFEQILIIAYIFDEKPFSEDMEIVGINNYDENIHFVNNIFNIVQYYLEHSVENKNSYNYVTLTNSTLRGICDYLIHYCLTQMFLHVDDLKILKNNFLDLISLKITS